MGGFSIFHWLIFLCFLVIPNILPLIIKRPAGRALYGKAPRAGVGFGEAINSGFNQYAYVYGRSSRSEFWWFRLFSVFVSLAITLIAIVTHLQILRLALFGLLVPDIAVTVRRLHDNNRSGWWILLAYMGGFIPVIYMLCQPSWKDDRETASVFE